MRQISILALLQANKPTFSPTELNIADYVLSHPEEVYGRSIHELSRSTYVSSATITRFCHKLKLDGYREFQSLLAFDLASSAKEESAQITNLEPCDSTSQIIRKITRKNIQSVEMTEKLNSPESYERAAHMIQDAKQVCLLGMGASYLASKDFFHKLIRIQKTCTSSNDWHVQLVQAKSLSEGDLVIALSYSGTTPEVLVAAKAAQASGAKVLAVTRASHRSELARIADESLLVAPIEPVVRSSACASLMAQLSVLDILYATYINLDFDKNIDRLSNSSLADKKNDLIG